MLFILKDGFLFVHGPFDSIVKCSSLAQFPVDHLFHSIVSSLVLFVQVCCIRLCNSPFHLCLYILSFYLFESFSNQR